MCRGWLDVFFFQAGDGIRGGGGSRGLGRGEKGPVLQGPEGGCRIDVITGTGGSDLGNDIYCSIQEQIKWLGVQCDWYLAIRDDHTSSLVSSYT